ncbi:MAG: hypothetical protein JWM06_3096 [Actinomycetia bacterium]|jgi:hypothetical protein|nr:hypothetical protein [Actinomycetes bacterium]
MHAVSPLPRRRGFELLVAHCASLDPDAPSARDRLDTALGRELAQRLVLALTRAGSERFAA